MRDPAPYIMSQFQQQQKLACPYSQSPFQRQQKPACNSSRRLPSDAFEILRLPNELLERILDFITDQAALAALSLSCKHLQTLATPRIERAVLHVQTDRRKPVMRDKTLKMLEQYLSIPQINAIRARDPELLGPPPLLPGRYAFGVPPQVRMLTEAVICCDMVDDILEEYFCAFLRNAKNLRLIQLVGDISS